MEAIVFSKPKLQDLYRAYLFTGDVDGLIKLFSKFSHLIIKVKEERKQKKLRQKP